MGCKVSKDVENPTTDPLGLDVEEEEEEEDMVVGNVQEDGEEEQLKKVAETEQSVELTELDVLKRCFIELQQAILEENIVQDFLAKRDGFLEQVRLASSIRELAEHIKHLEVWESV